MHGTDGWGSYRTGRGGGWAGNAWGGRQGPPPWVQELVRSFGGPDLGGSRGGPKVRRGDVRSAILDVLSGGAMNGYQIIQQISERTNGAWKPSPGSVYPTVQQLEDEGLVTSDESEGRRLLALTEAGRAYVEDRADELKATWRPFEETEDPGHENVTTHDLKPLAGQVMSAFWQVMMHGTPQQRAEAAEILSETRRRLYGVLAEGDPE